MRRILLDISIIFALSALAWVVWAGQQRPPDLYLNQILNRGVLRVGTDPSYPPFEIVKSGVVEGYDANLARALAADLGVRVEFAPLALDTVYDALAAEKVDVLISALPFIYERQKEVRYSVTYYQSGQVLLVRTGDTRITAVRDLADKKVGVELGSNADTQARRLTRTTVPTMSLHSIYSSPQEAMDALVNGEVDAAIADNTSAQAYEQAHPKAVTILSPPLTDEPYVVAMPVRAAGLATSINATIERLRASGELARMMGVASK